MNLSSTPNGMSYSWSGPGGWTSSSQNPSRAGVTTAMAGNYTVTVTSGAGCTATATTNVVINPNPTPTASNNGPLCEGQTLNLSSTPNGMSYSWSGPGGWTSSSQNPSRAGVTTAMAGNYTVTVTSGAGCTATATTNVVINPNPTPTASNNGPLCEGQTLNLSSTPNGMSYSWSGPGGWTSSSQNPSRAGVTTAMAGNYTVTVTSGAGCTATATTNVVINPNPTPTASNNGPLCEGQTLNLSSTPNGMSYSWSGPGGWTSSSQNPSRAGVTTAMAGNYTVTVTSGAGCTATATTNVVINPNPTPTASNNGPLCEGQTLNLSSTPNGMSYSWSGPGGWTSSSQNPSRAGVTTAMAGNYTVTVTSGAGCTATATTNVVINPNPTPTASNNGPLCEGQTLNLSSTPNGMNYSWSGPGGWTSSSQNPSRAGVTTAMAGNYTVTVTSGAGCTATATTNVVINPAPVISASNNGPLCVGDNLQLTANGSGGTDYSWSGPDGFSSNFQNPTISNAQLVNDGTYTVTLTNTITGCTASASTIVNVSICCPTITCPPDININLCNQSIPAGATTLLDFISLGGSYTYATSISYVDNTVNGCTSITTRTYTVDNGTCSASCDQFISRVTDIIPPTASNPDPISVNCISDVPIPNVSVVSDASDNCTLSPNITWVSDVSDGNYCPENITRTFSVSDDCGNSINVTQTITVIPSIAPIVPADGSLAVSCVSDAISPITPTVTDICGNNIIPVLLSVVDNPNPITCEGTRTYTYRYSDCAGNWSDWNFVYTINYDIPLVTPANVSTTVECLSNAVNPGPPANINDGCGRVVAPIFIGIEYNPDPLTCEGTVLYRYRYVACDGTSADWTYTYNVDISIPPVVPADGSSTVECITDAVAPTTPIVTDACGNNIPAVLVGVVDSPNPLTCEGTRVYTYSYTDCAMNVSLWTYTYTIDISTVPVVPANGNSTVSCVADAIPPVTPVVTDACGNNLTPVLSAIVDSPNPLICGGTRVYEYSYTDCSGNTNIWSYIYQINNPVITIICPTNQTFDAVPGDIYSIPQLSASSNCSGTFSISWSISGATNRSGSGNDASGLFNIGTSVIDWVVTDYCGNVHNCQTTVEIVFPNIVCPSSFSVCSDAGLQQLNNNGEDPLNGVFSGTSVTAISGNYYFNPGIAQGVYPITYTWTNTNGYVGTCSFNITVNELPQFSITNIHDPLCNGSSDGIISLSITNGTAPYQINWTVASDITSLNNYNITGLGAGSYSIVINDFNGCSYSQNTQLINPPVLSANINITSNYNGYGVSCFGSSNGSAQVIVTGGTPNYSYLWSNSASSQTSQSANNLSAGSHSVTVTDSNGCTVSANISITQPEQLNISTVVNNNVSCYGFTNGSATAIANGGVPGYNFLWNDPSGTIGPNANQLPFGTWTVSVTDQNSCSAQTQVTISQPPQLNASVVSNNVRCFGESNGYIIVTASGGTVGTEGYNYLWNISGNGNVPYAQNLVAGSYTVIVSDLNNCSLSVTTQITQPDPLIVTLSTMPVVCGFSQGVVQANVAGGTPSYSYLWSNNSNVPVQQNVSSGAYSVTVNDSNGCSAAGETFVATQGTLSLNITELSPISCYGVSDGALSVTSNGANPVNYLWSNEQTSALIMNIPAGFYYVTASDAWGCSGSANYNLIQPNQILISFETVNVKCYGGNDGSLNVIPSGGVIPYSYYWNIGSGNQMIQNLTADVYVVTVTDAHGCSNSGQATVSQPQSPLNITYTLGDVKCYGNADGFINVTAVGGTPNYSYFWQNGNYNSNMTNLQNLYAGEYYLSVTDINNCTFDTTFVISEPAPISATYSYQSPSCIGNNNGYIEVHVVGGTYPYTFIWNNGYSPVGNIESLVQGYYLITVVDANECEYVLNPITLTDVDEECLKIPNAFTPNEDGVNDTWIIENIHLYPNAYIHVYNRWGQIIFEAKGSDDPWDGKFNGRYVPVGTYLYIIELFNGTKPKTGTVTVVY
ncbi:MAG: gliding motility-associated C-terminal domain-containing protein [Bacteroidales bacterium]